MNNTLKKTLKITGIIVAIPIVIFCFVLAINIKDSYFHECERGPLQSIQSCSYHQSIVTWMNSGWWYSDATGPLESSVCKVVEEGEEKFPIVSFVQDKNPEMMYKVSCELFGAGIKGNCYAVQSMASNGNTRYVKILMADGCERARFFKGSKYTIIDGKGAEPTDWVTPYDAIPEENTGKPPEKQLYGQIIQKLSQEIALFTGA